MKFLNIFKPKSASSMRQEMLREAQLKLLQAQDSATYYRKMVEYYQDRIKSLKED